MTPTRIVHSEITRCDDAFAWVVIATQATWSTTEPASQVLDGGVCVTRRQAKREAARAMKAAR